jgi:hypothetical protein
MAKKTEDLIEALKVEFDFSDFIILGVTPENESSGLRFVRSKDLDALDCAWILLEAQAMMLGEIDEDDVIVVH